MFINRCTAYVPINDMLELRSLYRQILIYGQNSLARDEATILAALTDIKDLHLHLHVFQSQNRPRSNTHLLYRLMEVIRHISLSCTLHCIRWCGERRKVLVHLDYLLIHYWSTHTRFDNCSLVNIIIQMGKNKNIDWTLAYYVPAGSVTPSGGHLFNPSDSRDRFETALQKCLTYDNIRIRKEINGCEK